MFSKRKRFVASSEDAYFVGVLSYDSRGGPESVQRLYDSGSEENFLRDREEIGKPIGRINGYEIFEWRPAGQTRGSFEDSEEISEIEAEELHELYREYRKDKEKLEEGLRTI